MRTPMTPLPLAPAQGESGRLRHSMQEYSPPRLAARLSTTAIALGAVGVGGTIVLDLVEGWLLQWPQVAMLLMLHAKPALGASVALFAGGVVGRRYLRRQAKRVPEVE